MVKYYAPPGIEMCKWPRNQSTSQYGGLSTSQYGGFSTSQYGGLSTSQGGGLSISSSNIYTSNIPPWSMSPPPL